MLYEIGNFTQQESLTCSFIPEQSPLNPSYLQSSDDTSYFKTRSICCTFYCTQRKNNFIQRIIGNILWGERTERSACDSNLSICLEATRPLGVLLSGRRVGSWRNNDLMRSAEELFNPFLMMTVLFTEICRFGLQRWGCLFILKLQGERNRCDFQVQK